MKGMMEGDEEGEEEALELDDEQGILVVDD